MDGLNRMIGLDLIEDGIPIRWLGPDETDRIGYRSDGITRIRMNRLKHQLDGIDWVNGVQEEM